MSDDPLRTRPWTQDELDHLDRRELIRIAGARADGTLRPLVLIGHVKRPSGWPR